MLFRSAKSGGILPTADPASRRSDFRRADPGMPDRIGFLALPRFRAVDPGMPDPAPRLADCLLSALDSEISSVVFYLRRRPIPDFFSAVRPHLPKNRDSESLPPVLTRPCRIDPQNRKTDLAGPIQNRTPLLNRPSRIVRAKTIRLAKSKSTSL